MTNVSNIIIFSINRIFIQVLSRVIEKADIKCEVTILDSLQQANVVKTYHDNTLVIVDNIIHGASGYELLSYLRLDAKLTSPIVYFGLSEQDSEIKALKQGANYYISKPFTPDKVLELINEVLNKTY